MRPEFSMEGMNGLIAAAELRVVKNFPVTDLEQSYREEYRRGAVRVSRAIRIRNIRGIVREGDYKGWCPNPIPSNGRECLVTPSKRGPDSL